MISRAQVLQAGGTDELIDARLAGEKWLRLHPGVFLTHTGPVPRLAELWGALLYAGAGAAISHETAAELWQLVDEPSPTVHVTLPVNRRVVSRHGVRIHYAHRLSRTRHPARMPPVVNIEDTVLDLVDTASAPRYAIDWVSRACQRRKTTPARLLAALAARKKIRWREPVQDALADVSGGAETPLEQVYLRRVERAHGLPRGTRQRHRRVASRTQWIDVDYDLFRYASNSTAGWGTSAKVRSGTAPGTTGRARKASSRCGTAGRKPTPTAARLPGRWQWYSTATAGTTKPGLATPPVQSR